jgi:3-mercaptopropionate dioxygenase
MSSPAFASFVRDAERLIDDPHAIAERLEPLLAADGWLAPEHQLAGRDTYRQHLLHVSACRRLSVVALVWLPGQETPIHDHVSWCVVGVYRGVEHETHYRLIERDGARSLVPVGAFDARAGHVEALVPPAENIHSRSRSTSTAPTSNGWARASAAASTRSSPSWRADRRRDLIRR